MPRHATTFLDMKRNLAEAQIAERLKTPWILIIYWRAVEFTFARGARKFPTARFQSWDLEPCTFFSGINLLRGKTAG